MNTLEAIRERYSCRNYQEGQISEEHLKTILQAAYEAPNADADYEHMMLTVIQSKEALEDITVLYQKAVGNEKANPLYGAPTFIVLSTLVPENDPVGYSNAGCVIENMALAATELGLSSVYIYGIFDDFRLRGNQVLKAYLSLPDDLEPISGIAIGYPGVMREKRKLPKERIRTVYL